MNRSSKKITFVLGSVTGGGAERVAVHLMNSWLNKGYYLTLISMREKSYDAFHVPENVHRIVLGGEGASKNKFIALIKNFLYTLKLRKVIKNVDRPIIISFLTRANIYTILACFGLRKHVIISERNDTTKQVLEWPWAWLRYRLYKYANVVTANSNVTVQSMKSYVPENKLKFVPNPVNIPLNSDLSTPDQSTIILNVARLASHKNQKLILKAISKINNLDEAWKLQILGDGEEKENLIKLGKELEITDRLDLPGFVDDPSKNYQASALFVLPSLYEGTPNALLEAMSYGLPPVVSDCLPGVLELVEDGVTGLVFKSEDSSNLAKKIKHLIDNPKLRVKIGLAARERVRMYTPENVIHEWERSIFEGFDSKSVNHISNK
ncbi:MAG: glycosyltransferase family 4 protein [Balneolaceae bacterium]|nr:glycosyltransferase family 4 protein [Balneolaceae bacterium]